MRFENRLMPKPRLVLFVCTFLGAGGGFREAFPIPGMKASVLEEDDRKKEERADG